LKRHSWENTETMVDKSWRRFLHLFEVGAKKLVISTKPAFFAYGVLALIFAVVLGRTQVIDWCVVFRIAGSSSRTGITWAQKTRTTWPFASSPRCQCILFLWKWNCSRAFLLTLQFLKSPRDTELACASLTFSCSAMNTCLCRRGTSPTETNACADQRSATRGTFALNLARERCFRDLLYSVARHSLWHRGSAKFEFVEIVHF